MLRIGLIRERKIPADERVAFSPRQCAAIQKAWPGVQIVVEPSPVRCFRDEEYASEDIELTTDLADCDVLLGIKEVPATELLPGKTYCFFSHTRKKQPKNRGLMQALVQKGIRMIDYECLTYADEQRILGFGFFAGIVGAHNGLRTFGQKMGHYWLPAAHEVGSYHEMMKAYDHMKLPAMKIVVTGSGKVASGVLDVLAQLDIEAVEPSDFVTHQYEYPVFTHLKGADLYVRKDNDLFHRDDFHAHPDAYKCLFSAYVNQADILLNGIYWEQRIPRLFEKEDVRRLDWRIGVIADITCDVDGSVPLNIRSSTIADPVYGIDRQTLTEATPYQESRDFIDVMAVDNLPNELPYDASEYFGAHFEKYILPEFMKPHSDILARATICEGGRLTRRFGYLEDYAY